MSGHERHVLVNLSPSPFFSLATEASKRLLPVITLIGKESIGWALFQPSHHITESQHIERKKMRFGFVSLSTIAMPGHQPRHNSALTVNETE